MRSAGAGRTDDDRGLHVLRHPPLPAGVRRDVGRRRDRGPHRRRGRHPRGPAAGVPHDDLARGDHMVRVEHGSRAARAALVVHVGRYDVARDRPAHCRPACATRRAASSTRPSPCAARRAARDRAAAPMQTDEAVHAVEGLWWSDGKPLKRHLDIGLADNTVRPWLVRGLPFAPDAEPEAFPCPRSTTLTAVTSAASSRCASTPTSPKPRRCARRSPESRPSSPPSANSPCSSPKPAAKSREHFAPDVDQPWPPGPRRGRCDIGGVARPAAVPADHETPRPLAAMRPRGFRRVARALFLRTSCWNFKHGKEHEGRQAREGKNQSVLLPRRSLRSLRLSPNEEDAGARLPSRESSSATCVTASSSSYAPGRCSPPDRDSAWRNSRRCTLRRSRWR